MYPAGLLNTKIQILNPHTAESEYGGETLEYVDGGMIYANVKFQKAGSILRNGNIIQQGSILVTCRLTNKLSNRSQIRWQGNLYRIDNLDTDPYERTHTISASKIDE